MKRSAFWTGGFSEELGEPCVFVGRFGSDFKPSSLTLHTMELEPVRIHLLTQTMLPPPRAKRKPFPEDPSNPP